mmetsp:Transcript_83137/g.201522  ORF Transcript_83137/g.201522 Transcript_83137/m.201522 type:complete len:371 (-) Transcript_83137:153-1265(-)
MRDHGSPAARRRFPLPRRPRRDVDVRRGVHVPPRGHGRGAPRRDVLRRVHRRAHVHGVRDRVREASRFSPVQGSRASREAGVQQRRARRIAVLLRDVLQGRGRGRDRRRGQRPRRDRRSRGVHRPARDARRRRRRHPGRDHRLKLILRVGALRGRLRARESAPHGRRRAHRRVRGDLIADHVRRDEPFHRRRVAGDQGNAEQNEDGRRRPEHAVRRRARRVRRVRRGHRRAGPRGREEGPHCPRVRPRGEQGAVRDGGPHRVVARERQRRRRRRAPGRREDARAAQRFARGSWRAVRRREGDGRGRERRGQVRRLVSRRRERHGEPERGGGPEQRARGDARDSGLAVAEGARAEAVARGRVRGRGEPAVL